MVTSIYTVQSNFNTIYNTNYGTDIAVTDDIQPIFTLVTGPILLANAAYRRIITPYGALGLIGGDPNYGIGAYSWINSEITQANISGWQSQAQSQLELDERIASADCVISFDSQTNTMTMTITLFPVIGGSFVLVVDIQDITAQQLIGTQNG